MSIMNFLAQIMSGNVQVDPEMKSQIAQAMSGGAEAPNAGGGRGYLNPSMPTGPQAPARMVGTTSPAARAAVPKDEAGFESMIARVMGGDSTDGLMNAQAPVASPMQAAMQPSPAAPMAAAMAPAAAPPEQGILGKTGGYLNQQFGFTDPDFISRLGNGLAIAGSQDPYKALMMLRAQQAEEQKNRQARLKAMQGETKPYGTDGVFAEYGPDGKLLRTFVDPTAAASAAAARGDKTNNDMLKTVNAGVIQEMIKKQMEMFNKTVDEAGGATSKPEYSPEVQRQVTKLDNIISKIPAINTVEIPGVGPVESPLLASIRDNTYGRVANTDEYKTRRDLAGYYSKDVLADVKKLGANPSNADREFIAKPIPKEDDPIAYQIEYAKEMRERLNAAEERRVAAASRRDTMGSSSAASGVVVPRAATPAPSAAPQGGPARPAAAPSRMVVPGISQRTFELYGKQ